MARLLIDEMSGEELDPAKYPDRYHTALRKLLAAKSPAEGAAEGKGKGASEEGGRKGEVVDLMAALKASLAQRGGKAARRRRKRAA